MSGEEEEDDDEEDDGGGGEDEGMVRGGMGPYFKVGLELAVVEGEFVIVAPKSPFR